MLYRVDNASIIAVERYRLRCDANEYSGTNHGWRREVLNCEGERTTDQLKRENKRARETYCKGIGIFLWDLQKYRRFGVHRRLVELPCVSSQFRYMDRPLKGNKEKKKEVISKLYSKIEVSTYS